MGRESVTGALVDERARVLAERQSPGPWKSARAAGTAVAGLLLELAALPQRQSGEVKAVGLSVPGVVEPRAERISSLLLDWRRVLLRPAIERALEESGVDIRLPISAVHSKAARTDSSHPPIVIIPTPTAQVAAEVWCGAARSKRHVVRLSVGREITAGVIADGRTLQGGGGWAGAAGWLALSETFRHEYERVGCLTTEANDAALVRRTIESWTSEVDSALSRLASADPAQLTPTTVIRAAQSGDPLAVRVVGDVCAWLGRAAADLISLLNPEVLVLGGEMGAALRPFLTDIRRESRRWAHPEAARQCRIVSTRLAGRAALLGAARLAWLKAEAVEVA